MPTVKNYFESKSKKVSAFTDEAYEIIDNAVEEAGIRGGVYDKKNGDPRAMLIPLVVLLNKAEQWRYPAGPNKKEWNQYSDIFMALEGAIVKIEKALG